MEPIETSKFGANHAGLYAQNDRWGLVPIETCMLVHKSLFCLRKPQMSAGTNETSVSFAKVAILHAQNHRWGLESI